jgi:hypothetical protein
MRRGARRRIGRIGAKRFAKQAAGFTPHDARAQFRSHRTIHSQSWPGLSWLVVAIDVVLPKARKKDVDARDKRV